MGTGDNLFTFLSAGNSVDRAFGIYLNRWLLFTQLALLVIIPQIALTVTLSKVMAVDTSETDPESTPDPFAAMTPQKVFVLGIEFIFSYLFGIIIQAAIIQVVAEYYTQKVSTFKGSMKIAMDRFCSIFCFGLLYSAGLTVFFISMFVPLFLVIGNDKFTFAAFILVVAAFGFAVYVQLSLIVVLPILVIENQSPIGAIKRSFELVPGYRCYIFCSVLLLVIVVLFGTLIYQGFVGAVFGTSIVAVLLNGLSGIVSLPLQTTIVTVLYFSVRVQKEGLNMETLLKELEIDSDGARNYQNVLLGEADCEVV